MSGGAQRVLDALIEYDKECGFGFPIQAIIEFFNGNIGEDYEALTAEEESQVIEAFLDFSY